MYVILSTYHKPLPEMDALRPRHLAFLDTYYAKGIFIASGRQDPPVGGCILANGVSRDELDAILAQDPFATAGAATYQVITVNANKFVNDQAKELLG